MIRRLIIFIALALAGCARFHPKPISPAETAAILESRSLTNTVLKTFLEKNLHREFVNLPAEKWDVEMLTLAAFYYHPSLDVARAQWRVTQAGVKTAGGRPNPTLTVTPGYNTTFVSGVTPWFPAVNLDIPIETAGKRGKRISVAEQLSESARLNIATTAWQVRSGVRAKLLNFAVVQRREALLKKQVATQEQLVKLFGQKIEAGDLAGWVLSSARTALTKARLDLTDAQSQFAEARVNLAEAIGVPAGALDAVQFSFELRGAPDTVKNLTLAGVQRQALLSRTDILGALAEYAAAEATLRLEIAKQYPDVHLNPGYQFDQGADKWSLGIGVDLPVFNHNQGPIAEAEARRGEVAARFNELQARVMTAIERALSVFRVSESNSALLQSLADDQEKQRASIEAQFKSGELERGNLLNAELESLTSQMVGLDGQFKLQQAIGNLEEALQSPIGWTDVLWMVTPRNTTTKGQQHE